MRKRFSTVRKTIISAVVLLVFLLIGGAAYVYFSDQNYQEKPGASPAATQPATQFPKPVKPGANVPEGVAIESLTSPVNAGDNASVDVITNAGSSCTILVQYNGIASTDSGLITKKADDYGTVAWSWTVKPNTPVGSWPVKVTCVYNGKTGVAIGNQEVTLN